MGHANRVVMLALGLLATGCMNSPPGASPPRASANSAPESAWESLFNGHDLSGWTPLGTAHWRVEDGVIVGTQDGDPDLHGLLTTNRQFKDFELYIDFNLEEHGKYNSGVYLRNDPGVERQTGYQVNIGRGVVGEFCGGLYRNGWLGKGDEKDAIRKPEQWNTLHITADGPHILVDLNGTPVVDYTEKGDDPKLLAPGTIGLQTYGAEHHAGHVRFRNIKVREILHAVSEITSKGSRLLAGYHTAAWKDSPRSQSGRFANPT